jgi:carbon monoxide dehydrogenase subunit G
MEINGKQVISADRQTVWDALNDPAILRQCLPGCESVEKTSDTEFKVVVATAIGPLRARFQGTLRMDEADPPKSCVMVFEGQGGAVGFGKGSTTVALNDTAEGTELAYSANAQVGGKLAQVGSRLIDNVAKKLSDDFFKAFKKCLGTGSDAAVDAPIVTPAEKPASQSTQAKPPRSSLSSDGLAHTTPNVQEPIRRGGTEKLPIMVPGWWLGVASILGMLAAVIGSQLAR